MRKKKLLFGLMAVVMLSISVTSVYASVHTSAGRKEAEKHNTIKQEVKYESFTGIVKEINTSSTEKNTNYVLVENQEGAQVNFVVTKDTYLVDNKKIEIGAEFTGYYDANLMTIMIYPPQYKAEVGVIRHKNSNIKVDHFDKDLISADRFLKLNIGKDTVIVKEDGTEFKGNLSNRKLLVSYDFISKSLPAQTTPSKVVVLSETELPEGNEGSYYGSLTGIVTKITNTGKGNSTIQVKSSEDQEAYFTVTEDTYRTNKAKVKVGSTVTGYYDAKLMMIMIYPMVYTAEVLEVVEENSNVKVDYFDHRLVSSDGTLKLHLNSATEIINQDGTAYKGRPVKRNLVVIYDTTTRSIPAQTHPSKVIVLSDN